MNRKFRIACHMLTVATALFFTSLFAYDFHSQASQDRFVQDILFRLLSPSNQGYYLEIGAADPVKNNNTYFFEKEYGWKGVSIDINRQYERQWLALRENPLLVQNALSANYELILESFPTTIDYLSLDIDGRYDVVLGLLPLDKYIFKVITIEHDAYRFQDRFRPKEREILLSKGYVLLCPDVCIDGLAFEDWWIHPSAFDPESVTFLTALDFSQKNHEEIIATLENALISLP